MPTMPRNYALSDIIHWNPDARKQPEHGTAAMETVTVETDQGRLRTRVMVP